MTFKTLNAFLISDFKALTRADRGPTFENCYLRWKWS